MNATRILVVACCVPFFQGEAAAQTRLGVFGGVNLGKLAPGESGLTYSTRSFPAGGGIIDVGLGRNVFLRAEPMFLQKGSRLAIAADDFLFPEDVSLDLRTSYFELPLLVVVSKGGEGVRPYALAGPTFGFLVGAKARAQGEEVDFESSSRRGDLGISLGGGLQFPAGAASVFVETRYTQWLWDVFKDARQDPRPRNRGLLFGVGATFAVGARAAVGVASPQQPPARSGFWMGFGLAYGSARVSCKEAGLPICDRTESTGGPSGLLSAGWTLTPKILLGVEASVWAGHTNAGQAATFDDFFLAQGPTLGGVSLAGYFYPFRSRGLFVKGGAGPAFHVPSREGIPTSWGWGWTAGVGFDLRVSRDLSLTPVVSVQFASIGDTPLYPPDETRVNDLPPDLADEVAQLNVAHGLRHNAIDVGLRVTLH
jgi:hypothetical protein